MIKKLDKLVLKAFFAPFFLTLGVAIFILLMQAMLNRFKDMVGKGIDFWVFAKMFFYFSLNVAPIAFPLAVLLSSIMSFGSLGQHNEITAVKSTGISLLRVLRPIGVFAFLLSGAAFVFNNTIVPYANLEAYTLLWDIKKTKPALEFQNGIFYNDIPDISIRVGHKSGPDGSDLSDVLIYDHRPGRGNTNVITASSGKVYTIEEGKYLILDLYNGSRNEDMSLTKGKLKEKEFIRTYFQRAQLILNIDGLFKLDTTQKDVFKDHPLMKNVSELKRDSDSLLMVSDRRFLQKKRAYMGQFLYHFATLDTAKQEGTRFETGIYVKAPPTENAIITQAVKRAETFYKTLKSDTDPFVHELKVNSAKSAMEMHLKISDALACFIMFLIGAPIGAIIKRGGLGLPVLFSVFFFVVWYVLREAGKGYVKELVLPAWVGAWMANAILLLVGIWLMRQARKDARLFEKDYYSTLWKKMKERFFKKKQSI